MNEKIAKITLVLLLISGAVHSQTNSDKKWTFFTQTLDGDKYYTPDSGPDFYDGYSKLWLKVKHTQEVVNGKKYYNTYDLRLITAYCANQTVSLDALIIYTSAGKPIASYTWESQPTPVPPGTCMSAIFGTLCH
ncbi:MAG TPA: hypothetical protein VGG71_10165 [Chitinophagaceae bacterium]